MSCLLKLYPNINWYLATCVTRWHQKANAPSHREPRIIFQYITSRLVIFMDDRFSPSVHHCVPDWNISETVGWIDGKFGAHINIPLRVSQKLQDKNVFCLKPLQGTLFVCWFCCPLWTKAVWAFHRKNLDSLTPLCLLWKWVNERRNTFFILVFLFTHNFLQDAGKYFCLCEIKL